MKIKKHLSTILLLSILLLGAYLRLVNFPNIPPSLNWDEVSIGYNAYSINETGKDEFGNSFPLYFRSLDDYKQPVYVYLVAVTQNVFGYSDFSVRFPSAFFGILSILVLYFLTFELFRKKQLALISAFIFAILPWAVQFSRYGSEANVALFFMLLGIFTFLKSLNKKVWLMPLSLILFTISSYTYLSYKIVAPLVIVALFIIFFKKINFKNKFVILSIIILLVSIGLTINNSLNSQGQTRYKGTTILNDFDTFDKELNEMFYEAQLGINLPRRLFHEIPAITNAGLITKGYLKQFSTDFLFFNDNNRFNLTPNVGLLYLWMLPFIISGIYFAFKKYDRRNTFLLFSLILIAPIPASVTYDTPHAIRVFLITVPFTILSAIGIYEIFKYLKKYKLFQFLFMGLLIVFIFFGTWQFFRQNQIHSSWERSEDWQYGRREMTDFIIKNKDNYNKVIISPNLEWPYAFILYYSKYDPTKYLAQGGTKSGAFDFEGNKFDNLYFRKINLKSDLKSNGKILLVGKPDDFPSEVEPIKTIKYLDGKPAIYFINNMTTSQ